MHAFREFIQDQMDARGWNQAELSRRSGLSSQLVSKLLNDERDRLSGMPRIETVEGLARAFGTAPDAVAKQAALAYGVAGAQPDDHVQARELSNEELVHELTQRLDRSQQTQSPSSLDMATLGAQGPALVIECLEHLRETADASEATGDHGVALVQRFLVGQLEQVLADAKSAAPAGSPVGENAGPLAFCP